MIPRRVEVIASVFRWLGRALAVLLFLFWGAFFVEHLSEWFLNARRGELPLWVWGSQVLHLGMLIGLLLMLRWEKLGTVVTVLATTAFFANIGVSSFPYIALLNAAPVLCVAVSWMIRPSIGSHGEPAGGKAGLSLS